MKNITTIYIDSVLLAEAKARGINLHKAVEGFLRELFKMEEKTTSNKEKVLTELADAKHRLAIIEAQEKEAPERYEAWKKKNVQLGAYTSFKEWKEAGYDKV